MLRLMFLRYSTCL